MFRPFHDRNHQVSSSIKAFRHRLQTAIGIAVVCGPATAFAAFPSVIDVVADSSELRSDAHITVDGQWTRSRSMGDLDSDGLGDRIIQIRATDTDPCPGVAIWLSTQNTAFTFLRSELDALVRITDEAIPDNQGGIDCRYGNLRVFNEPRRLGDVNGDGLIDLAVSVSGISDNTRIVFGTIVGGTRINIDALDGSNGFTITGIAQQVFPVGDVNGDGHDDMGHSSRNSRLSGVIAGRASFNATLEITDTPNEQSLVGPMNISRLRGLGDIDGDGHTDMVAYPTDLEEPGENQIPRFFYGASNLAIRSINEPNQRIVRMLPECGPRQCQFFSVGDIDNDGRDDILASQRFQSINIPPRSILYGRAGGLIPRNEINDYPEGERTQLVRGSAGTIADRGEFYDGTFNRAVTGQRFDFDGDGTEDLLLEAFFAPRRHGAYVLFGLPGQRPAVRSLDEADGFLGVTFDLGEVVTPFSSLNTPELGDINLDGIDDYFWTDDLEVPYVPGRSRNLDGVDVLGLGVRRSPEQLMLFWNEVAGAITYRIEYDDRLIEEVLSDTTERTLADDTDGASLVVTVKAIDSNGLTLSSQIRRVPEFVPVIESYSAAVYGPELLELFIEPNLDVFDRELLQNLVVVRDGEVIGLTQVTSYLDRTVTQGRTFSYQLFSNVLVGSNFNNTTLNMGPRIQLATGVVLAETPVDPNAVDPVDPVDPDNNPSGNPAPPFNLRVERYSAFDAEVFWDRADEEGLLYEFFRDGELIRTLSGISVYDPRRPENSGATYEVIALRNDGSRSESRSVVLEPIVNIENDNTDNNGGNEGENTNPNAPEAPENLRVVRYSFKDAELFWERAADPFLQYEVKRDGIVQRSAFFGISYFDRFLEPDAEAFYEVTAIAADGTRSAVSTITLPGENAASVTPAP